MTMAQTHSINQWEWEGERKAIRQDTAVWGDRIIQESWVHRLARKSSALVVTFHSVKILHLNNG